jgi:glycosyltransferase involved in cell wall biosynthesis
LRFNLDDADPYAAAVRRAAVAGGVCVSARPVVHAELDDLVASADIGLALYADRSGPAARLMGLASGKIASYLKCGLPVVATALPTLREFIEGYRCGVCVESIEEIPAALALIDSDYVEFRRNAFRCFEERFDPDPYAGVIERRLRELVGRP